MARAKPTPKPKAEQKPPGKPAKKGVGKPVLKSPKKIAIKEAPKSTRASTTAATRLKEGEGHRRREAERSRMSSAARRECGPLPAVADPERKARGRDSLLAFCRDYFPRRFRLPFAEPHLVAVDRIERCTDRGGLFACALPRGMGKTTIAECAALRAVLCGLRKFVVVVSATAALARRRLKQLVRELEANDVLLADFPEACWPLRALERIHNRARGQTLGGVPTRIELTADGVILPTVAGAASSGAVVQVFGMEGALRGLNVLGPDGDPLRPDFVILDDVQTRDSAKSVVQTADREAVVTGEVLGLAGPGVELAAVMLCTTIFPGDLSDRFLDPARRPEWQGVRTRMLESFPDRMDLWDEYAEVRRESFRSGDGGRRADEFLAARHEDMHRGARVTWPERKRPGEVSALQSAMNLYYSDPRGFRAEYQNDPEPAGGPAWAKEFDPAAVAARTNGVPRGAVPREAVRLTCFIDVGSGLLWYAVVATDGAFGGAVVDAGAWPRQARAVFAAADARPTLAQQYPGRASESAWVYAGLMDLADQVLGREYPRDGGGAGLRVERCLVDSGWQRDAVYQFARATPHAGVIYPSKGVGRTVLTRGVSEWRPRDGERSGWHWRLTAGEGGRGRVVQYDPDAWKSFLHERLTTPPAGRGALTLYGRDAAAHDLLAHHLAAEAAEPVTVRGITFDKWQVRPHRPDNHLLDCVAGALVAAGVQGAEWSASGDPAPPPVPRKKVKLSDLYYQKHGGRPGERTRPR
ncbi:MAG: hypothetical protein C0501_17485 [Isosphaera sp.]|nr:hypothetical protein [Isosphaera sp.]